MKKKIILALTISIMCSCNGFSLAQTVGVADSVKPEPEAAVVPIENKKPFFASL